MVTFSQIKKVSGNIPWDGYKIFLAIKSQLKENAGNILGSNWSNEAKLKLQKSKEIKFSTNFDKTMTTITIVIKKKKKP